MSRKTDPYITAGREQHVWGDAIGDFMKTSQSAYGNVDGSTSFYTWSTGSGALTCSDMEGYGIDEEDGTYGRKLFYEARGYKVTDCYAQSTNNVATGGFSFAKFKAEIDAGRPVFLNLKGHSIAGVGYNDSADTKIIYVHDTWDNDTYSMEWGTSYAGLQLLSVSIVNIGESAPEIPDISVSHNSYDFGSVDIGNTSTQTFEISNNGTAPLNIETILMGEPSEFTIYEDDCSNQIITAPAICTFKARFSPTTAGTKSATIIIPSNDLDENPFNITLSGTGADATAVDLSGSWLSVSWTGPKKGVYTVSGTFVITNASQTNLSNVQVEFYFEDMVKTYKYKVLPADTSKATTIKFTTTSDPRGKYLSAKIDPNNMIAESNEGNNFVSSQPLP